MYKKSRDHIEQIKSSGTTLHNGVKFRGYIEQIKSEGPHYIYS